MADKFTCPVCGRGDIHLYKDEENPKCPNCGSDLKIYQLLDELREEQVAKKNIWKPIAIVAILAAVIFALMSASAGGKGDSRQVVELRDSIKGLQENVNDLKRQLDPSIKAPVTPDGTSQIAEDVKAEQTTPSQPKQEEKTEQGPKAAKFVVVQKGDTYVKISQRAFGDKNHVKDIERLNPKKSSSKLSIGDSIRVQ
ncbi:MAG: LysM peptidoglycan-binding domain-containing protein [Prevotella sp.]|nr:LysM peptidoglycan-binding domain-containing protein [Prevotella sp.]